jgi:3-methyladenine DNA glycosylase AlkC
MSLKLLIDHRLLKKMASSLKQVHPAFDQKSFIKLKGIDDLELKARVQLIRDHLRAHLPADFKKATKILLSSARTHDLRGFDLWPYTEFIQTYGLDHPDFSFQALKELTPLFTSEFAVRPFLTKYPQEGLNYLLLCAQDKDVHVRRWASEGSRPRLPWGEKLQHLIKDPTQTLPILELLKNDDELYVRKSVANHLNDIAKDHPTLVLKTLSRWKEESDQANLSKIEWIVSRALRNLIKAGEPQALELIGASSSAKAQIQNFNLLRDKLKLGDRLTFSFDLVAQTKGKFVVDFVLHFMKANGKLGAKVFKLRDFVLEKRDRVSVKKSHHIKAITTRVYYPGIQKLELMVNGRKQIEVSWTLKL